MAVADNHGNIRAINHNQFNPISPRRITTYKRSAPSLIQRHSQLQYLHHQNLYRLSGTADCQLEVAFYHFLIKIFTTSHVSTPRFAITHTSHNIEDTYERKKLPKLVI